MIKQHLPYKEFVSIIYEELIDNKTIYAELRSTIKDSDLLIEVNQKKSELEYFYLWMFLITYCLQRKFAYLGNEKVKQILDLFHKRLYKSDLSVADNLDVQNLLTIRYNQYYKAIKEDWQLMEDNVKNVVLFGALTFVFTENLVNRKINYVKDFGQFRLLLGLFLAELIKTYLNFFEKTKNNYEISFNS